MNRLSVNGESAAYTPLDDATVRQLEAAERPQHGYARETVQGRSHPVLSTPAWPAARSFDEITVPEGCYFMIQVTSITLTNDPQVVKLALPAEATRFWRARAR